MIAKEKYNYLFYFILLILVVVLLFVANTLSISYKEALNVFTNTSLLSYITKTSIYFFGQNDIALRLPFLTFYVLSILLMYKLTEGYYKYEKDRFFSILVFMILPGVLSASLLVNSAILVIFFTLLYLYYFQTYKKHWYVLLFIYVFIDNSFAILFLAIFFFSLKDKDKKILLFSLFLFTFSMYLYGFNTDGKPRGYFLDTFAIYATIFSPLVFIYFVYTIYREGIKGEKSLSWYISVTALLLSLLFSLRQRVYIEDFAPYVVISLPLLLKSFYHSYRVRLKQFRKKHKIAMNITILMLLLNVLFTMVNKPLYLIIPNVENHIAYKYHFAKDIAAQLKEKNYHSINTNDGKLQLRLKYYGINENSNYYFTKEKEDKTIDDIKIYYHNKKLVNYYISKK